MQTGPQPEQRRARALLRWPERKERAFSRPSQSVGWSRNPARCGSGGSGPAWRALPGRQVGAGQAAAYTTIDTATLTRTVDVAQDAEEVVQEEEAEMARGGGAALPRARA